MIPALGAGGPGFKSRRGPIFYNHITFILLIINAVAYQITKILFFLEKNMLQIKNFACTFLNYIDWPDSSNDSNTPSCSSDPKGLNNSLEIRSIGIVFDHALSVNLNRAPFLACSRARWRRVGSLTHAWVPRRSCKNTAGLRSSKWVDGRTLCPMWFTRFRADLSSRAPWLARACGYNQSVVRRRSRPWGEQCDRERVEEKEREIGSTREESAFVANVAWRTATVSPRGFFQLATPALDTKEPHRCHDRLLSVSPSWMLCDALRGRDHFLTRSFFFFGPDGIRLVFV